MAKLLQLSRPSSRVSNAVRTWLALRSRKRRRQRNAAPAEPPVEIPTPTIQTWNVVWDYVEGVRTATVTVEYEFLSNLPVGVLEVWDGEHLETAALIGTTPSDAPWWVDPRGFKGEATCWYWMRYVGGGLVGPFSGVTVVDVVAE
jgi:hypothetical protein